METTHPASVAGSLPARLRRLSHAVADSWLPFAAAFVAFGVDLVTPRAISDIYVLPIFACLSARSPRVPLYTAALTSPLMVLGFFLSPQDGTSVTVGVVDRVLTLLIVWVGAMLTIRRLNSIAVAEEAHAEARLSERRFRVMADGVPAIIWVSNARGGIEFVNREYCTFFGVELEQVQKEGWVPLLHPDDAGRYTAKYFAALSNKAPFNARARVRHASGSWHWIESSGAPRFSETGEFLGHVGLSPDITAIVMGEETLLEADRRKDEFLATLSHELRNPLAPIRNAAQILASPSITPEQLQSASGMIRRQAAHMAALLDDLLDLARITQGKLKLRMERVALTEVIDAAVEAARPSLERKSHRLVVSLPSEEAVIHADRLRLAQVFSNLLTNAAKYTDPGGHIEITGRSEQRAVRVAVKDNGVGIPSSALGDIFMMFRQVDEASAHSDGGIGIGLALVKGLVELHSGTVEARSAGRGQGSEFIVHLPLAAPEARPQPAPEKAPENDVTRRRVLIADDNRDAADSLALLLTLAGHEVRVAYDGITAVSLAQALRPQVAILDIGMPELDGYAVAQALRRESWGGDILLIALTGWGQEEDKRRSASAGFDIHLTKPVDPDQVHAFFSSEARRSRNRS